MVLPVEPPREDFKSDDGTSSRLGIQGGALLSISQLRNAGLAVRKEIFDFSVRGFRFG